MAGIYVWGQLSTINLICMYQTLYLTGAPGAGKTTLAKKIAMHDLVIIPELPDPFPKDNYIKPDLSLDATLSLDVLINTILS